MIRLTLSLALTLALALSVSLQAFAVNPSTDDTSAGPQVDRSSALVQLAGDPLSISAKTMTTPASTASSAAWTIGSGQASVFW